MKHNILICVPSSTQKKQGILIPSPNLQLIPSQHPLNMSPPKNHPHILYIPPPQPLLHTQQLPLRTLWLDHSRQLTPTAPPIPFRSRMFLKKLHPLSRSSHISGMRTVERHILDVEYDCYFFQAWHYFEHFFKVEEIDFVECVVVERC